ncbi:MAG: histidinol-phosphate transaminase [Oleiphilaceae bacterium]|nr:histidinol-phosphate transaminase [Oleiphilaceae bacterium]
MKDQLAREARVENLIRPEIQSLKSYHVPPSEGLLKLDAMENPYPWPGQLQEEWLVCLQQVEANRYPDAGAQAVRQALREHLQLDALQQSTNTELDILLGNGSDEIIQMLAMCCARQGASILAPEPGFVMYQMIARFAGMDYIGVPLQADFSLDEAAMLQAIDERQPALIFLAVPNNPTGNVFDKSAITRIIHAAKGLVVIDEAYLPFTDSDLLSMCAEYPNVVVMRTLSKAGLAGLRLGMLIGATSWLREFDKVRLPYNINVLTQASAVFALKHYATLSKQTESLRQERTCLFADLEKLGGVEAFESEANFILVRCTHKPARDVFEAMKVAGVLIKCLDGAHPMLANCLRLTVGRAEDNEQMLSALQQALK